VGRERGPPPWAGSVGRERGPPPWAASVGRLRGPARWAASVGRLRGPARWAASVGRERGPRASPSQSELDPQREHRHPHAAVLRHGLAGGPERGDRVPHLAAGEPQVPQLRPVGLRQLLPALEVRLARRAHDAAGAAPAELQRLQIDARPRPAPHEVHHALGVLRHRLGPGRGLPGAGRPHEDREERQRRPALRALHVHRGQAAVHLGVVHAEQGASAHDAARRVPARHLLAVPDAQSAPIREHAAARRPPAGGLAHARRARPHAARPHAARPQRKKESAQVLGRALLGLSLKHLESQTGQSHGIVHLCAPRVYQYMEHLPLAITAALALEHKLRAHQHARVFFYRHTSDFICLLFYFNCNCLDQY
jgi:hypothetical protein